MKNYRFRDRELLYVSAVMLLVPALRLLPSLSAKAAGKGAWLTAPAAGPLIIIYALFLCRFMAQRRNSEGMAELIKRGAGTWALCVSALWFLLYAGFVLRAGADRLITTIFPGSAPSFFSVLTGLAALIAVLGPARSITRTAKLMFPLVYGVLAAILIFACGEIELRNLLPLTAEDVGPVMRGSVSAVDVTVCVMYAVCFLKQDTDKEEGSFKALALWSVGAVLILGFVIFDIVGSFGSELTAKLTRPFFSLVRNMVFFRTLERMEALAVALWVFPDFITVSVFLFAAQHCLRLAFGFEADYRGESFGDMSRGRFLIWLSAAAAISAAVIIAPDSAALEQWSSDIIPKLNLLYAFALLPLLYIILKKKA